MSSPWLSGPVLTRLIVAAAVLWHLFAVFAPPRQRFAPGTEGRDFASYYYAAKVAVEGGDPYHKGSLDSRAAEDQTRSEVHPFFYPPPFLWLAVWTAAFPLMVAFWLWFIVNELALIAAALALVRSWRALGPEVLPLVVVIGALMDGVAYSAQLGQVNAPVLLLVVLALGAADKRPALAGVLVGLAAMLKMSPALFVIWFLMRRQWTAVLAAVLTAVLTSLLTLPLLSLFGQLTFYRDVLPQFASGDYNGLVIKIEMFGNHSIPNLWHQYFPSGENRLSTVARALSTASTVTILAILTAAFRPAPAGAQADTMRTAAQGSAILVAMLLIPVYTYEHHLMFAIPPMVLGALAVSRGWLGPGWIPVLGLALPILLLDLVSVRLFAVKVVTEANPAGFFWLQEAKFFALLALGAAMVRLGGPRFADPSRAPAPLPA